MQRLPTFFLFIPANIGSETDYKKDGFINA